METNLLNQAGKTRTEHTHTQKKKRNQNKLYVLKGHTYTTTRAH